MTIRLCLFGFDNGECWSVRVKIVFPLDTGFAVLKHVVVFNGMHRVAHVVRDLGLQLADKPLECAHLDNAEMAHVFQVEDVPRDGVKVFVDCGKSLIGLELAFKMVSSQGFLHEREFWSGLRSCRHTGVARSGYSR